MWTEGSDLELRYLRSRTIIGSELELHQGFFQNTSELYKTWKNEKIYETSTDVHILSSEIRNRQKWVYTRSSHHLLLHLRWFIFRGFLWQRTGKRKWTCRRCGATFGTTRRGGNLIGVYNWLIFFMGQFLRNVGWSSWNHDNCLVPPLKNHILLSPENQWLEAESVPIENRF